MADSPAEKVGLQQDVVRLAWSRKLPAGVAGLSLARERRRLLAWDQNNWIHLLDGEANAQAQHHVRDLAAASAADDGSAYAVVSANGQVWWLAPDMTARWEKRLDAGLMAVALDAHGQFLAASDNRGSVQIFDRPGQTVRHLHLPRPIQHLSFVPSAPYLVGCADYGLVTAFNLNGEILWENRPLVRVGGLSVSGDGKQILLPSFSDGIQRFDAYGKKMGSLQIAEACCLAVQSFSGESILAAGFSKKLFFLNSDGKTLTDHALEKTPSDLALSALGDQLFVGFENGLVVMLSIAI